MKKYFMVIFVIFLTTSTLYLSSCSRPEGKLRLTSDQEGATIYVNGKKKAITGEGYTDLLLPEGEHEIRIEKPIDDSWVYRGTKKVFVGGKTSTKIEIETKKSLSEKGQKDRGIINVLNFHSGYVRACAVSDGKVIIGTDDSTIDIWELKSGKLLNTLKGHTNCVSALTVSGGKIISGARDDSIRIWDLDTGRLLNTLKGRESDDTINEIAVSDGKVISAVRDIDVWNLKSGKLLRTISTLQGRPRPIAFNSICLGYSERRIAVYTIYDNLYTTNSYCHHYINVFDLKSGKLLNRIEVNNMIESVAVSDGKIVSTSENTIKIWDLKSGKLLNTLKGHTGSVNSVAVSDGKIISGSWDKTVKIWDLYSGKLLNTLKGHTKYVNSVAVSDRKIISVSDDTIIIWKLSR